MSALGLVVNAIVLWNTLDMDQVVTQLHVEGQHIADDDLARLSPLGYEHINFLGRYSFELPEPRRRGGYRALRVPETQPLSDASDTC